MVKVLQEFAQERAKCGTNCADRVWWRAAVVLLAGCGLALGQDTLALSSAATTIGGTITLNLTLSAAGTAQPSGVEWTMAYSTVDLTSFNVAAGPTAVAAGKSISCSGGGGSYTCLIYGLNDNTISSGVIATITAAVSSSMTDTSSIVRILNPSATSSAGTLLAIAASAGNVSIRSPYTVTGLACAPAPLTTPGTASCTVTASASAPTGGLTVALGVASHGGSVTVPASVAIAAGAASARFNAAAAAVSATTMATLAASLNGASQSFSLQLMPELMPPAGPAIKQLTCSPATMGAYAAGVCTVTLSAAAPSSGATVTISVPSQAPLIAPSSVTLSAKSTSARFSIFTGSFTTNQAAAVTASLNGSSVSCSVNLAVSTKH